MKKLFALALLFSVVLFNQVNAQEKNKEKDKDKPRIEGSGNVITKEIAVQPFDELSISGVFSVLLSQGSKEQLKIEADDNLQELFEVKTEGSKLIISMKKDVNFQSKGDKNKMKVYITFRKLKAMDLKTVGNISSDANMDFDNLKIENKSVGSVDLKLTVQKLEIQNKSVGNFTLTGKADHAVIKHNGVGSFKASNLVVQTMDIDAQGVGGAEVNAVKEIKVSDSFLGKVKNVGAATIKKKVVI
jgi:hypothetical protein